MWRQCRPIIGAASHVVYILQDSSATRDIIIACIPAAVALAVVFIGGAMSSARMTRQIGQAERRWADEQRFEREKFATQERRTLYAGYIAALDRLSYTTCTSSHIWTILTKEGRCYVIGWTATTS